MRFKLVHPIINLDIIEAKSAQEGAELSFKLIPKKDRTDKITILDIDSSQTYTFKVHRHTSPDYLRRIEKKLDHLIRLHKQEFLIRK